MKKLIALMMLAVFLLTGCRQSEIIPPEVTLPPQTEAPTESMPESTENPPEPTQAIAEPEYTQQPMTAVSLPIVREYTQGDDDSTLFYYEYQDIYLTMQDPDVADQIIVDFLNRIDQTRTHAESVKQQALSDAGDPYVTLPYLYEIQYTPTRIDQSILSFFGTSYRYSGGNHPDHMCMAANYSLITGEVLTLGSLLTHEDSIAPLCQLVILELDKIAEDMYLLDDYDQIVKQRFAKDASFDEDWYFTGTGLCFYFAPYEIAGYSSGIITVEIPYHLLTGIIADEFFPAEEDVFEGNIVFERLDSTNLNEFSQIAEITIDQEGDMVLLSCTGAVRNVRIQSGSINADGTDFTPNSTIFGTYTLTPGDAIMLKITINDLMPDLRLSYESGGEMHHIMLSDSLLNS